MRFFDLNIAHKSFPGTYSAICESANSESCFDGLDYTFWSSNEYDTDGLSVWVERDFGSVQSFNRLFVQDTNIENISLQYWNGSAFATLTATAYKSVDLRSVLFEFTDPVSSKIRIIGTDTITLNEEKVLGSVFVFTELGRLVIPPSGINVKRVKEQDAHLLITGRKFIFNRGKRWEIEVSSQAHVGQADTTLLESLVKRDAEFHVWLNANNEVRMNQIIEPYAFKNMLKVSIAGGDNPNYYKNLFFSGVSNKFTMVEVE